MNAYFSVVGETVTEKIIEKSRFLTYTAHVEGEEAAKAFLERVRAMHSLATHVCYGYIADETGTHMRFSDDGEPQGTAGLPILNVLKMQKLMQTAIAVVRYFGGIKLGAGGLTRAYASCAAEGVSASEKRRYEECVELTVKVDYAEINAVTRFLEGYEILNRNFTEKAEFTVAVRAIESEAFQAELTNCLNGKVEIAERAKYAYAFLNKEKNI